MKSDPNKKAVYITPDTDEKLNALGGKTRADNIRRALAIVECAKELYESLEVMRADYNDAKDEWDNENYDYAVSVILEADRVIENYRELQKAT